MPSRHSTSSTSSFFTKLRSRRPVTKPSAPRPAALPMASRSHAHAAHPSYRPLFPLAYPHTFCISPRLLLSVISRLDRCTHKTACWRADPSNVALQRTARSKRS